MEELVKSREVFGFHIDGKNEIDAELLSNIIRDTAKLTQLAAQKENPEAYLKMNVTAFKDGCFQIDFSAICEVTKDLITGMLPLATLATSVVTVVKGIFEIKKHLNGKKAKSILPIDKANVCIENENGQKITVPRSSQIVINNIQVDNLSGNIVNCIQEHSPNGGFHFEDSSGIIVFTAQDLTAMSKPLPVSEESIYKISRLQAELPIKKADLLGRSTWEFKYGNHRISAKIEDEELVDAVHRGASVAAGDYIFATLEIRVEINEKGLPIDGTEQYTVLEAHGGIKHKKEDLQTII